MNKRPFIYLGIAIAAALAILIIERPERPRVGQSHDDAFMPDFDVSKVVRMEIEQLLDGAELKRIGDDWEVSEWLTQIKKELLEKEGSHITAPSPHTADKKRVTGALDALASIKQGVIVSDNPEKQAIYQVDRTGLKLRLYDANEKLIAGLIIGKSGPDFASTYIHPTDENKVYLVRRPLMGVFSPRSDDWREKDPVD